MTSGRNQFSLRPASPTDSGKIFDMIVELARFEKLEHEVVCTAEQVEKELFGDAKEGSTKVILAEVDGEIVGMALYFLSFSTFLGKHGIYLEDLYVREAYRNMGIGKGLLRELGRIAVEKGFGRVEWSVLDWNQKAIRVYESIGAKPNEGWTMYRLTGESLTNFGEGH